MSALAIDVGGTKTLVGLVGDDGEVLAEREFATRVDGDDIDTVAEGVRAALSDWDAAPEIAGAGFPEYVDARGRLTSHEVLTWSRQPEQVLTEALRAAGAAHPVVRIESDVRLGAWGELRFGAGASFESFVYISLGTGLSSTVVVEGRPWPGARGEAIALGEWPSPDEGTNLEAYASGTGIERRYRELTGRELDGRALAAAARAGDDVAAGVLASAGTALGRACAQLVAVLDPAAIVLGGGLGTAGTPLTAALERAYAEAGRRPSHPPLLAAALGHRAGLLGAAALAFSAAA